VSLPALWYRARRHWLRRRLKHPEFAFLLDEPAAQEWVALDCETTGLQVGVDHLIAIAAVRITGNRIRASERLDMRVRPRRPLDVAAIRVHHLREQDVAEGLPVREAVSRLLHFVGARPMVGYHLAFDVAMLNQVVVPMLGVGLPQPKIDVASLYREHKLQQMPAFMRHPAPRMDLGLDAIMKDLDLPRYLAHDPFNDALMAGLAFLKLRQLAAA